MSPLPSGLRWRARLRASGLHLLVSLAVAILAASLVFGVWYPGAFRLMAGGRDLFFLVTSCDVVMGPLLTLCIFNVAKPMRSLRRDVAIIAVLQMLALGYGLHTVYLARPVAMVFEVDRLRLVNAADIESVDLEKAPEAFRRLSLTGPKLLGTRRPSSDERVDAIFQGLAGKDISRRPMFWQPYDASRRDVLQRSRPVAALLDRYAARSPELRASLADFHADLASARFLPVMARGDWVAILDREANVLGYLPFDGFF